MIDTFRAEQSRTRLRAVPALDDPLASWAGLAANPDSSEHVVRSWVVEEALRRIGVDHRDATVQTYLLDRSYDEVAIELGIPTSTLRSRVFYGLKALRVVLEELEVEL